MKAKPNRISISVAVRMASLALTLLFAAAPGHAQTAGVLVTDVKANTQLGTSYVKQGLQYTKQLAQYEQEVATQVNTLSTYQALMANIQNVVNNPAGSLIPANTNMQHLSQSQIDGLVQYQCNNTSGDLAGDLISTLANAVNIGGSNIAQSQQQICANIVVAQSDRYNATADLYNQMPQFHQTLGGLNNLMTSISNVSGGNAGAQAATFNDQQIQAINDWQSRITVDENVIVTLQAQQQALAQIALRGTPSLAGEAIQTAAFAAAFNQ